jgi:hypothetical protein
MWGNSRGHSTGLTLSGKWLGQTLRLLSAGKFNNSHTSYDNIRHSLVTGRGFPFIEKFVRLGAACAQTFIADHPLEGLDSLGLTKLS